MHGLLALGLGSLLAGAAPHPMHTAITEITHEAATGSAAIRIRVFADDFRAVVAGGSDSAMAAYVRGTFSLADRSGRVLQLGWEGAATEGDVLVIRLRVAAPAGLSAVRVKSELLSDRFEDQVNVVRAVYGGRTATPLFVRGDPVKALP